MAYEIKMKRPVELIGSFLFFSILDIYDNVITIQYFIIISHCLCLLANVKVEKSKMLGKICDFIKIFNIQFWLL